MLKRPLDSAIKLAKHQKKTVLEGKPGGMTRIVVKGHLNLDQLAHSETPIGRVQVTAG